MLLSFTWVRLPATQAIFISSMVIVLLGVEMMKDSSCTERVRCGDYRPRYILIASFPITVLHNHRP